MHLCSLAHNLVLIHACHDVTHNTYASRVITHDPNVKKSSLIVFSLSGVVKYPKTSL